MAEALFESKLVPNQGRTSIEGLSGSKVYNGRYFRKRKNQLQEAATAGSTMAGNVALLNKVMLPID